MWFKDDPNTPQKDRSVYIILDRSGSMANGWSETLGAINSYIKKLQDDVNVYVAAFDSDNGVDYRQLRETVSQSCAPITNDDVTPRGMTPLYDAVGKCADKMLADNPKKAVLVVMTDGEENSSKEYSRESIKSKLKLLESKDWATVFLGADFDKVADYALYNFGTARAASYNTSKSNRGATFNLMAAKTGAYFTGNSSVSATETMSMTDEEKSKLDAEA